MGIASLILESVSLVMMFLVIVAKISFGAIPTICAIVGIIIGIVQNKKETSHKVISKMCSLYCFQPDSKLIVTYFHYINYSGNKGNDDFKYRVTYICHQVRVLK